MLHSRKHRLIVIFGNLIDQYDLSLYSFLAPVMAPLFFPHFQPAIQLVFAYGVLGIGTLIRPLGAFLGTAMIRSYGPRTALLYSIALTSLGSLLVGFTPVYETVGFLGAVMLLIFRFLTELGTTSERTIGRMYLLEGQTQTQGVRWTSYYEAISMVGVLLASGATGFVTSQASPQAYWRIPFILGALGTFGLFFLRYQTSFKEPVRPRNEIPPARDYIFAMFAEWRTFVPATIVSMFGLVPYYMAFVLFNAYIPLITNISLAQMVRLGTVFVVLDIALFLGLGRYLSRFDPSKVMRVTALLLIGSSFPLFYFLEGSQILYVILCRLWLIILGVAFTCPTLVWKRDLLKPKYRYFLSGLADILGGIVTRNVVPLSMALYSFTQYAPSPSFFVISMGLLAWGVLKYWDPHVKACASH
jgi:MHS family proline/betaine transporter-like MFS transporter